MSKAPPAAAGVVVPVVPVPGWDPSVVGVPEGDGADAGGDCPGVGGGALGTRPPAGVAAIPTMGRLSGRPPMDPRKVASPKAKMPPSEATNQYPWPVAVGAIPTI